MRALLIAILFLFAACEGGINIPEGTDAATDPPAGDTDPGPADDAPPQVPADTDPPATDTDIDDATDEGGYCANASDLATLAALDPADIADAAQSCAFGCARPPQGTSPRACIANCMEGELGVSADCADCFGGIGVCVIVNCLGQCFNPSSSACETCRQNNCEPAFRTCAGVDPI